MPSAYCLFCFQWILLPHAFFRVMCSQYRSHYTSLRHFWFDYIRVCSAESQRMSMLNTMNARTHLWAFVFSNLVSMALWLIRGKQTFSCNNHEHLFWTVAAKWTCSDVWNSLIDQLSKIHWKHEKIRLTFLENLLHAYTFIFMLLRC